MPGTALRHRPHPYASESAKALAAITTKNGLSREFPPAAEEAARRAAEGTPLPERDQ